jgi:hypothetical protein
MPSLLLVLAAFAAAAGRFEPVKVLREKGVEPAKLTLEASHGQLHGVANLSLSARYGSVVINGVSAVSPDPASPLWEIGANPLPDELRGKGVGTLLYLLAARLVSDTSGGTIFSDPKGRSPDADAVWTRLKAMGAAERVAMNGQPVDMIGRDRDALVEATAPALAFLNAYDPQAVLAKHGVDVSNLRFDVEVKRVGSAPRRIQLKAHDGERRVGFLDLGREEGTNSLWNVYAADVLESYRGKGLGMLLYLAGARLVADEAGGRLSSWLAGRSSYARRMWDRLREAGLARTTGFLALNRIDVMTRDRGVLEAATEKARAFVASRLR